MADAKAVGATAPAKKMYLVVKTFYDEGGRLVPPGVQYPWLVSDDNPLPAVLRENPEAPKATKGD